MTIKKLTALLAPLLLFPWISSHAHHSTASFFHLDRRISIEGTVVEFHARNPHGLIVLDVVNEAGETERWRAEMPAWQALLRWLGWSAEDLQPGDAIVIHGAPPRMNESFSIRADDIVMPDGWTRHMFRDPVTNRYRTPTPPARAVVELDGVWELNRGWTDHPDDNPDTFERPDFRPYTRPEVLAVWLERDPLGDPSLDCEPPTVSAAMSGIHAIAIDQSGEHVRLFAEAFDVERIVYMDGRSHPGENAPHANLGHSVGRYEGETLVVETTHITAGWSMGAGGPPHSDRLRVVERYRVIEDGRLLEQAITVEDPLTLTQPVTYVQHLRRAEIPELVPYDCMPLNTDRGEELTPEEFYQPSRG